jgi:chromosome segregation protein
MLSALELAGFKSFADKTRFDFPDGITVVVGPNGSGKSNIVDAIKWVLGTQSAKSLRGDDMADVIFKGSAAGGRKPCNSAEATLILDNRDRQLGIDADEVHVTRRVFRSGESEYLINREPRRLKDIRDLFRGTGVGIDAYSLIEQGKIDRMLQASAKDRRGIFEEAAGISRFKTKKVETDRRLQRVEQSLVRLKDIVDEVHTRLTTLKNQASKAQQFRQMTARMSELRLQVGIDEHRSISHKIAEIERSLVDNETKRFALSEQLTQATQRVEEAESNLAEQVSETEAAQKQQQAYREKVAGLESSQIALRDRIAELTHERSLNLARQVALAERADLSAEEVQQQKSELDRWQTEWTDQSTRVQQIDTLRRQLEGQLTNHQRLLSTSREEIAILERKDNQERSSAIAERTKLEHLENQYQSFREQCDELGIEIQALESLIQQRQSDQEKYEQGCRVAEQFLLNAQLELERVRAEIAQRQESAMHHQGRLQGIRERLILLEQLEEQQEGVGRGAKKLLELANNEPQSPWNSVKGLVADLIEIDVHLAPLIDVALGSVAETVVLDDGRIIDLIREGTLNLDGRVAMLRVDRLPSRRSGEKIQLDGLRGVLGRADRLVHFKPEYAPLFHYLLGTTWLVDSLSTALDLSHLRGAGLRFVTATCERIDADGTLSIGSLQTALGLVSRRSEMLAAREEIRSLEEMIATEAAEIARLHAQAESNQEKVKSSDLQHQQSRRQVSEATVQLAADVRLLEQRHSEIQVMLVDQKRVEDEIVVAKSSIQIAEENTQKAQVAVESLRISIVEQQSSIVACEKELSQVRESWTGEKVVLARLEQRLESLRTTLEQLNRDSQERQSAVFEVQQTLLAIDLKLAQADENIREAEVQQREFSTQIESGASRLSALQQVSQELQAVRRDATKQFDQTQRQLDRALEQQRALDNEMNQHRSRVTELLTRYREDYELDLSDQELVAQAPSLEDRGQVESEISQLRQDIASVGSVNMEALQELDELQSRYDILDGHYQDLTNAKLNLQKIIEKIDVDSQRLFAETLEAIRVNFQELYRRSFGGGHADLVLEQCEDMSEAGVEIVATPPGKTAFSNSLLSGGEKALTAVALIMAIFKYRPSPFCILDEVDAPFDEANIGRFVSVLTEFLHMTKFVVVSHSKKTMTAATTIYGVTMQESGVSRQVAVRFEDVKDDSDFLKPTPKRAA